MSKRVLETLFNSRARVRLLRFLFRNYPKSFSTKELAERLQEDQKTLKKEIGQFEEIKLLARTKSKVNKAEVCYALNGDFQFIQELRDLILKYPSAEKEEITSRLSQIGRIRLAVIAGAFLDRENPQNAPTDLLLVSDYLDRRKFSTFLKYLEAETGGEIRFVVMEKDEFAYRLSMFDRFVRVLLEGPHEKLINRLGV